MTNSQLTKLEYLQQLESKLTVLPATERQNAIQYYNDFITNSPDEAEAIAGLGAPSEVAADILASYVKRGNQQPPPVTATPIFERGARKGITDYWWLIIIIAVFAFPVIIGVGGGLIGLVTGIGAALFAFAVSGVTMIATGAVSLVLSVFILFQDVGFGLIAAGAGLVLMGIGILLVKLAIVVFKGIFELIRKLVRRIQNGRPQPV